MIVDPYHVSINLKIPVRDRFLMPPLLGNNSNDQGRITEVLQFVLVPLKKLH